MMTLEEAIEKGWDAYDKFYRANPADFTKSSTPFIAEAVRAWAKENAEPVSPASERFMRPLGILAVPLDKFGTLRGPEDESDAG
jgi:hypothetical protein